MQLSPKEIQESPEERMRREGKPSVDMSGKEYPFTSARRRLDLLLLRQLPAPQGEEALVLILLQSAGSDSGRQLLAMDEASRAARTRGGVARGFLGLLVLGGGVPRHLR